MVKVDLTQSKACLYYIVSNKYGARMNMLIRDISPSSSIN